MYKPGKQAQTLRPIDQALAAAANLGEGGFRHTCHGWHRKHHLNPVSVYKDIELLLLEHGASYQRLKSDRRHGAWGMVQEHWHT
jgi:hypothetical protein